MRRLVFRSVVLAATALFAVGCGIGAESSPTPLAGQDDDPIVLPEEGAVDPSSDAAVVYLVRDERLVPVARRLATADAAVDEQPDPMIDALLEAVLAGPTVAEADAGVTTAIPPPTDALGAELDGGTVSIDLSRDFAGIGGIEEILAVGQIVLTLTDRPEVDAVVFALDGQPTVVPDGTGALTDRPVGSDDYVELLSP